MKELSLRPYPGTIRLCNSKKEYKKEYKKLFNKPIDMTGKFGRMDGLWHEDTMQPIWLVWAVDDARLAHEFAHVIFHVFELVDINPTEAHNEPFCYMLSQLLIEAKQA